MSTGDRALGRAGPGWGVTDFLIAVAVGYLGAAVVETVVLSAGGWKTANAAPGWALLIVQLPLWAAMVGVPWWAATTKGRGAVEELGLRIAWIDLPVGAVVGAGAQYLIPYLYAPFSSKVSNEELGRPARQLASQFGHGIGASVLLVLMVSVLAPLTEEVLYRGLLMRSLDRRWGAWVAVVGSGVVFGLMHFEKWQTIGLAAFGMVLALLARRTGRIGTSVIAHVAFNTAAVIPLLHR